MDQGQVTNLCHWHCDLCRQFVTHEPGDLCDITEKNSAGDQRWALVAGGALPHGGSGLSGTPRRPQYLQHLC